MLARAISDASEPLCLFPSHRAHVPCAVLMRTRARAGNALSRWRRRYFIMLPDGTLYYFNKPLDRAAGRAPSGELHCRGSLILVESGDRTRTFDFRFALETKERVLLLRAETEFDRSSWVCALLAAGAQYHPLSSHLSAHLPQPSAPVSTTSRESADASTLAVVAARSGAARTYVDVPAGLRAGGQFQVEVPTGERFTVTVPRGATGQIEVIVPARCLAATPASAPASAPASDTKVDLPVSAVPEGHPPGSGESKGGGGASGGPTSSCCGRSGALDERGDLTWTLCRRFDVAVHKWKNEPLGLALAPSRSGHLTVTDVTPDGLAESCGAFQLGDMIVSINGKSLNADLDEFIRTMGALASGEISLGVQRVEDEAALQLLLEQVSAEQHRLEFEKQSLAQGIRDSQEERCLEVAMERSLDLASKEATATSADETRMREALDKSIDDHEAAATAAAEEASEIVKSIDDHEAAAAEAAEEASELERQVTRDARAFAERALLESVVKQSKKGVRAAVEAAPQREKETVTQREEPTPVPEEPTPVPAKAAPVPEEAAPVPEEPIPVSEEAAPVQAAPVPEEPEEAEAEEPAEVEAQAEAEDEPVDLSERSEGFGSARQLNAVRTLEHGFSRSDRSLAAKASAAARSRAETSCASCASANSGSGIGELPYRSDSIRRVYAAQHHFVLAQLTAPGVEAFLADDFSDEEEEEEEAAAGGFSRSTSKFV